MCIRLIQLLVADLAYLAVWIPVQIALCSFGMSAIGLSVDAIRPIDRSQCDVRSMMTMTPL